jgi:hypothetical protein
MQLANYDLRMTAGRPRYPIMFRVSGYSHKSYFTLATVPGLASLTLSPKGSLSYIYPNIQDPTQDGFPTLFTAKSEKTVKAGMKSVYFLADGNSTQYSVLSSLYHI